MSNHNYPRVASAGGEILAGGVEYACAVCNGKIAVTMPRVHCWIQVSWFRGDDEDGYAHIGCGLRKFLVRERQVNKFNARQAKEQPK